MSPAWNVDGLSGGLAPAEPHASPGLVSETSQLLRNSLERSSQKRTSFNHRQPEEAVDPKEVFADVEVAPKKKQKWIILPQSRFRRIWVQITLVVAFYIIWVTPVRVGFNMQAQGPWFWIEGIIDIFFYADLVLNFFTAYENPATSELITDHKLIAKRYLSSWFWVDLLATFPSDYVVKGIQGTWGCSFRNDCPPPVDANTAVSIIVLLRTMRVFRIIWIFKNFNVLSVNTIIGRLMDEFITFRWMFSIMELMVVLMFLGHVCGCFFYMFSHPAWQSPVEKQLVEADLMTTWVLDKTGGYDVVQMPALLALFNPNSTYVDHNRVAQDPVSGSWYGCPDLYFIYTCSECKGMQLRCHAELGFNYRYITAMYWAYTTMTTVGYGDIYATTIAEKVWAMATMVIGGFFLSFCFGRIASIVGRLDADRAARAEQIESITQFLKDHELPKPLSRKVLDFFKNSVKSVRQYDRASVLARMPFDLRSRILQHMYDTCIKGIPMLQRMCDADPSFMADFTIRLHPYHTSADTTVYHKGEHSADLYILIRGEVHVMDDSLLTRLVRIPEGTIFGEAGVVHRLQGEERSKRLMNVKCETPCDMLRLPLADALELCDMYPELAKGLKRLHRARQQQLDILDTATGKDAQANGTGPLPDLHSNPQIRTPRPMPTLPPLSPFYVTQAPSGGPATPVAAQQQGSNAGGQPLEGNAATIPGSQLQGSGDIASLKAMCQGLQQEVAALRQMQADQLTTLAQLPAAIAAQLAGGVGGGTSPHHASSVGVMTVQPSLL